MDSETYLRECKDYSATAIKEWEKGGPEVKIFRGTLEEFTDAIISDNLPAPDDEEGFDLRPYLDKKRLTRDLARKFGVEEVYTESGRFVILNAGCF